MYEEKGYTHYNAEDFLKDSYFLTWMRKEDEQVNAFWEQWQVEHPDQKGTILEAIHCYQDLISFEKISPSNEDSGEVWQRIETGIQEHNQRKIFRWRLMEWSAAAIVTLLITTGWLFHHHEHRIKENFVIVQTGDEQKDLILPDSSEIFLNSYTSLKYNPDNCRELWFNGQAYFNIKHKGTLQDATVPFTVHAGIEDITVLGTSFTVKSIDSAARLILISGKVRASVGKTSLIIKPSEKITWGKEAFISEKVDPQLYLAWKDGEFRFNHTSLKDLASLIKDYYGYDLIVRNKAALHTKTISGTITSRDEAVLWKTIAVMFHAKEEKAGRKVILTIN